MKGRLLKLPKKEIKKDIEDLFHELSYWDYYAEKSIWLAGEFSLADILLFPVSKKKKISSIFKFIFL